MAVSSFPKDSNCRKSGGTTLGRNRLMRRKQISSSTTSISSGVINYYRRRSSSSGRSFRPVVSRRGSVRMKVRRLQRLVPGGRGLQPDLLFLQTANYILHLKFQVNVLQTLSNLYKP